MNPSIGKNSTKVLFVVLMILTVFVSGISAKEYPRFYRGVRPLGMGVEFQLPMILSFRAGLNQGYYTLGATVDVWVFQFDFATYGEEVGTHAGQREDRRYVGQISIGW